MFATSEVTIQRPKPAKLPCAKQAVSSPCSHQFSCINALSVHVAERLHFSPHILEWQFIEGGVRFCHIAEVNQPTILVSLNDIAPFENSLHNIGVWPPVRVYGSGEQLLRLFRADVERAFQSNTLKERFAFSCSLFASVIFALEVKSE
jgi:hypothetical protein